MITSSGENQQTEINFRSLKIEFRDSERQKTHHLDKLEMQSAKLTWI